MGLAVSEDILLADDALSENNFIRVFHTADGGRIVSFIDAEKRLLTQRYDAHGVQIGADTVLATGVPIWKTVLYELFATEDGGWLQSYILPELIDNRRVNVSHFVRYDADGKETFNRTETENNNQQLVKFSNDGFAILSSKSNGKGDDYQISARIFDANGHQIANKFIGTTFSSDYHVSTTYENGMWRVDFGGRDGAHTSTMFDAGGKALLSLDLDPGESVRFEAEGGYVLIRTIFAGSDIGIQKIYSHYDGSGTLLGEVTPPPYDYGNAYGGESLHTLSNGNVVVRWIGAGTHGELYMRVIDRLGNLVVADTLLGQVAIYSTPSSVLELSDGGWLVFWRGKVQAFDSDGNRHGKVMDTFPASDDMPRNVTATNDGGWAVTYQSDGSKDLPAGIYTSTFHLNDLNNAPHAHFTERLMTEDQVFRFWPNSFNAKDFDGDKIAQIEITTLPDSGQLRFKGTSVEAGDVIAVTDLQKLTWEPPANLNGDDAARFRYRAIDEHGVVSVQSAVFHFNISPVNDRPEGGDHTITLLEDEKYFLTKADFVFTDIDGDNLSYVRLNNLNENLTLHVNYRQTRHGYVSMDERDHGKNYIQPAENAYGQNFATLRTRVTDDGGYHGEGNNKEVGFHTLTINVLPVNDAPLGSNFSFAINPGQKVQLIDQHFTIDDVEGDRLKSIIIDSLPKFGTFTLDNTRIHVGDEIAFADTGRLTFDPGQGIPPIDRAKLHFSIHDNGGTANGGIDIDPTPNTLTFYISTSRTVYWGTRGDDHMTGSKVRDLLYGGAGDDILFGGRGSDQLRGGSGRDIFVFRSGNGNDYIKDFDVAHDIIDMTGSSLNSFEAVRRHHNQLPDDLLFFSTYTQGMHKRTDALWVENVRFEDLTEQNFMF